MQIIFAIDFRSVVTLGNHTTSKGHAKMLALIELWFIYLFWPVLLAAIVLFNILGWTAHKLDKLLGPEPPKRELTPIVDAPTPPWHWVFHGAVLSVVSLGIFGVIY